MTHQLIITIFTRPCVMRKDCFQAKLRHIRTIQQIPKHGDLVPVRTSWTEGSNIGIKMARATDLGNFHGVWPQCSCQKGSGRRFNKKIPYINNTVPCLERPYLRKPLVRHCHLTFDTTDSKGQFGGHHNRGILVTLCRMKQAPKPKLAPECQLS